jgi:hypothetical protein
VIDGVLVEDLNRSRESSAVTAALMRCCHVGCGDEVDGLLALLLGSLVGCCGGAFHLGSLSSAEPALPFADRSGDALFQFAGVDQLSGPPLI